jgi:hypothetical protein
MSSPLAPLQVDFTFDSPLFQLFPMSPTDAQARAAIAALGAAKSPGVEAEMAEPRFLHRACRNARARDRR